MRPKSKKLEELHPNDLLDKKQLADILGVSPKTCDLWRREGKPPKFQKYGRKFIRYKVSDVRDFLNN